MPDPTPSSILRRLFYGADGLRAGWSLLLFLLLLAAFGRSLSTLNHHLHFLPKAALAAKEMTPRTTAIGDGLQFAAIAFAALIMARIERRPFARYGLTLRRALPDFAAGLAWGLLILSLLIATLYLTHAIAFDRPALHGLTALASALQWAGAFLCVGLAEEFISRGYLQFTLARGIAGLTRALAPTNRHAHLIGFTAAAFLFSVCLFMAGHIGNSGETPWGIAAVGLAGAVFAFSLYRTGALWWAIGLHTAWDWAQSCLYGTPDSGIAAAGHILTSHPTGPALLSGGATGPEGSLLVVPTLLLVALVIHLTLPKRNPGAPAFDGFTVDPGDTPPDPPARPRNLHST